MRRCTTLVGATAVMLLAPMAWAHGVHELSPNHCKWYDNPPKLAYTVTGMWMFYSLSAHTISDPNRLPLVLGDNLTSDWDISLTTINPATGLTMPYAGIQFLLKPGGKPFDTNDAHAAFVHAVEPVEEEGVMTDVWLDAEGYHTDSGPAEHFWDQPIPEGLTQLQAAQYVWDNTMVPEPSGLLVIAGGLVSLLSLRRRRTRR